MAEYGYHSIPGSAELRTEPEGANPTVAELEALDPSAPAGREVDGEWLARAVVRSSYAPVLFDVFDRLMPAQSPAEAAVYLQLYRLSYGEERNWARVARRELRDRTGLSDRRLGGALAGLAEKKHIRLVHRNRQGTLYRVRLPHEVFAEPGGDRVMVVRPAAGKSPGPGPKKAPPPSRPPEKAKVAAAPPRTEGRPLKGYYYDRVSKQTTNPESGRDGAHRAQLTVGEVAGRFLQAHSQRGYAKVDVVEEILGRLEEGSSLEEIAEELDRFGTKAPRKTPITELSGWLARNPTPG